MNNRFSEGMNHIEEDVVIRFIQMDNKLKKKSKNGFIRWISLAACVSLVICSVVLLKSYEGVPVWDNAKYSAEDLAKMLGTLKSYGSTNSYVEVYVPEKSFLYLNEIPNDEYLNIYENSQTKKEENEKELVLFAEGFIHKLCNSLGISDHTYDSNDGRVEIETDSLDISIYQGKTSFLTSIKKENGKIVLDGETVQTDQRFSDEEIISSLESVKNKLFDIFGVSFSDARVIRKFDSHSEHGTNDIVVYFYNEADSLGNYVPDYIKIWFKNYGDIAVDDILTVADIRYKIRRDTTEKTFSVVETVKRISLEDAEKLLYKGYVFGGHSCPLCMREQEMISFKGYDFVSLEYVHCYAPNTMEQKWFVPFYAFYKKTGISPNGNIIYAKTYVAAIELKGYEEYFRIQKKNHS